MTTKNAPKVKLGQRPKSIPATVSVAMLDGSEGLIPVSFVYRTRTEFAQLMDDMVNKANSEAKASAAAAEAAPEGERTTTLTGDIQRLTVKSNADYLMLALDGWGLDEPFSRKAVEQLCDEMPAAATAIIERYRAAITEGRLGN